MNCSPPQAAGVQVRPYDAFLADVAAEAAAGHVLMLDTSKVSFAVYQVRLYVAQ
jgi:hypothetical protein